MKSQTSKKAIWLRSLLLLPLLGGLLFSFSNIKQIERETDAALSNLDSTNELIITLKPDGQFLYNDNIVSIEDIEALITSKTNTISIIDDGIISEAVTREAILDIGDLGVKNLNYNTTNAKNLERTNTESNLNTNDIVYIPSKAERLKGYFKDIINNNPVLEIKQNPLSLKLNGKTTSLETLTEDYETIVGEPRDLRIYVKGGIKMTLINTIRAKLKNYVNKINLSQGGHIIGDDTDIKKEEPTIPVVNGIKCDGCTLFLSKKGVEKLIISTTTREPIISFRVKFVGTRSVHVKGNTATNNKEIETNIENAKIGSIVQLFEIKTKNETLTPVIIELVDRNNPKYSNSPQVVKAENIKSDLPPPPPPPAPLVVKKGKRSLNEIIENTPKGLKTGYKSINGESHYYITYKNGVTVYYNRFGEAVDKNGKELPPPPPPPKPVKAAKPMKTAKAPKEMAEAKVKTGYLDIDGKKHYYTTIDGKTRYFNRYGVETNKKGKELTPNKQVSSDQVLPNSNISKVYFNDKVVSEFKTTGQSIEEEVPGVPSMLALSNNGGTFYYEGEKISGKKAIDLVDNNKDLNITIQGIDSKNPIIKLSKEPIRL